MSDPQTAQQTPENAHPNEPAESSSGGDHLTSPLLHMAPTTADVFAALGGEVLRLGHTITTLAEIGRQQAEAIERLTQRLAKVDLHSGGTAAAEMTRTPDPSMPLDISSAAERLGISQRTLHRALKAGAADLPGGPVDATPQSKRRTWRFSSTSLHEWWRRWGAAGSKPKAKRPKRARRSPRETPIARKPSGGVDWSAVARGG